MFTVNDTLKCTGGISWISFKSITLLNENLIFSKIKAKTRSIQRVQTSTKPANTLPTFTLKGIEVFLSINFVLFVLLEVRNEGSITDVYVDYTNIM